MGSVIMLVAPVVTHITGSPTLGMVFSALAVGSMLMGTLLYLITLPVELDASFAKALPILETGNYLHEGDLPHANKTLKPLHMIGVTISPVVTGKQQRR